MSNSSLIQLKFWERSLDVCRYTLEDMSEDCLLFQIIKRTISFGDLEELGIVRLIGENKHAITGYFFGRSGRMIEYILTAAENRFLDERTLSLLSPLDKHALMIDAAFYGLWDVVFQIDKDAVPVKVGKPKREKIYFLDKEKVLNNLGRESRLGKMILDKDQRGPYVFDHFTHVGFRDYTMKRITDANWFVDFDSLTEEGKDRVREEEQLHEVTLTPQPILVTMHNCNKYINANNNVITRTSGNGWNANALSCESLPLTGKFMFSVKVLKTSGSDIICGVAPSSFNTNGSNMYNSSGWHLGLDDGRLRSGPPTSYMGKEYHRKTVGEGEEVGVVVDREEKTISFVINGEDYGAAYKNVFKSDNDLRVCVIMCHEGDSVRVGPLRLCND
eukprot:m.132456 g.132456  ORF g.132456 m.132456 type:complete len:388 (-) comp13089_c0_seq15:83-1246(-)